VKRWTGGLNQSGKADWSGRRPGGSSSGKVTQRALSPMEGTSPADFRVFHGSGLSEAEEPDDRLKLAIEEKAESGEKMLSRWVDKKWPEPKTTGKRDRLRAVRPKIRSGWGEKRLILE